MNYRSAIEQAKKIGPIHDPALREAVIKVLMDDGSKPVSDGTLLKKAREVQGGMNPINVNGREADSPAKKLIEEHFSKQVRELCGEIRKQAALRAIDKSDKRTIGTAGPVPLSAIAAARVEKQHWTDMNPYSIVDQKPQLPGKPLTADDAVAPTAPRTADPLMTPAQIAQKGYLQTRRAAVIASMRH